MFYTIVIGIIATLFAYLARYRDFKYGLEFAFTIITIFLAIRYDWGNDYPSYLAMFKDINNYDSELFDYKALSQFRTGELGWVFLNRLFSPFGFFGLVIFLTVAEHYIIYRFIKNYVYANWFWFAVFIYVFSSGFMLTGSSMMRQFLAMCIYIVSIKYILERKPIQFVLLILLAASFHTSAYIMLPTYFITYLNLNLKPKHFFLIIPIFYIWVTYAVELAGNYAKILLSFEEFDKYNFYIGGKEMELNTGLGIVFFNIVFFTCSLLIYKLQPNTRKICLLMLLGFLFAPLAPIAPAIGRLGMYFSLLSIIIYPILFPKIENNIYKYFIMLGFVAITLKGFYSFFYSEVWHDHFFEYQTIFSAPDWM